MQYGELIDFLQNLGKDPSHLVFEDELTGLYNRRFLHSYLEHKVRWDSEGSFPLSLMVVEVDLSQSVHDPRPSDAGDEVLVSVAGLLEEVTGEAGYPIRFGADAFMVLLPKTELPRAVQFAHRLAELANEPPPKLDKGEVKLDFSLSIGVAAARNDASSGSDLIRIADTARHTSEKLGRNHVSVVSDIDAEKTYRMTALHRLSNVEIAGRGRELSAVSEALGSLSLGKSKFLVIEGAPGMGKSAIIETVRRSLGANDALHVVRVAGQRREGFRPYYILGDVLVTLMNHRPDKGASALDTLDEIDLHYLGYVLSPLDGGTPREIGSEGERREGIFVALVQLLGKLLDGKPLVLLVDDLQYVDEGSLTVLRALFHRKEISLLVCGTNDESASAQREGASPWGRFFHDRAGELSIAKLRLTPLGPQDIARHLSGLFPGIDLPDGFENVLAGVTKGNPSFLAGMIRKLVLDGTLKLDGQRWTVEPLEKTRLPRSLEELVGQNIGALDDCGRRLLEEASVLGDDVPLSVVTGSTETSEMKVLEFLDRAEAFGILRSDFHVNDETLHFVSRSVLEIVYGSIDETRRRELHGRVGSYQEELCKKRLGPSGSVLAYHFALSADQAKARHYDRIREEHARRTFNREEAESYLGEAFVGEDRQGVRRGAPLPTVRELVADTETSMTTTLVEETTEALIESLSTVGKKLLIEGEYDAIEETLRKLFADYADSGVAIRERIVRACRELMEALTQALQRRVAALSAEFLLLALRDEKEERLAAELANLLHRVTNSVLHLEDYTLASRIFAGLHDRGLLSHTIDASTQSLLMEGLRSKELVRREQVAHVLESMGKAAIPLLIEVIKQEKDFEARRLAAGILAKLGASAANRLKREVVLEVTSEQRFRILEVIDVVTRELRTELAFCLSDVNPKVRRAAFRLSERLDDDEQVLELLVDLSRHEDIGVAKGAIRSLVHLDSAQAVGALTSTLARTREPERAIACAQALAQLGDAEAVPALEGVLAARKFPIVGGKLWDDQVRATAAFALAQIGGERASRALMKATADPDARVRQIATAGPRPGSRGDDVEPRKNPKAEGEGKGVA